MADTVSVKFKGDIAAGSSPEKVLTALAQLFKTDPTKLQHWMSGQEVIIKRDISAEQAQKYVNAMAVAGAIAILETQGETPSNNEGMTAPAWDIAAVGSDVLRPDEIHQPTPVDVDISQYRALDNCELVIEEASLPPVSTPDTSSYDVNPPGLLVEEREIDRPTPLNPDTSQLDVLPPGDIENLEDDRPKTSPDTSHLSLE